MATSAHMDARLSMVLALMGAEGAKSFSRFFHCRYRSSWPLASCEVIGAIGLSVPAEFGLERRSLCRACWRLDSISVDSAWRTAHGEGMSRELRTYSTIR